MSSSSARLAAFAVVGSLAVAAWAAFGEPWALAGDGAQYLARATGAVIEAPFAFRPLAPALAAALAVGLQMPAEAAFFGLSWAALVALAVAFGVLGDRLGGARRGALAVVFCAASFAVAYGATTGVRTDPLMLVAVAAIVTVGRSRGGVALGALAVAGVLAHEMALFGLLALGVERALGASLFGRRASRVSWRALGAAGVAAVAVLAVVRASTLALPASLDNWADTSLVGLIADALAYGGGAVRYVGRVYVAFGPVALFALAALATRPRRDQIAAVGLVVAAVALTFLATDTLRVMALAGVVVLPLGAAFVDGLIARRSHMLAALALATQALFSAVVYGHLRTFEGSPALQATAGVLSVVAAGVAAASLWRARRAWGDGAHFPPLFNALRGRRAPRAVNVTQSTSPSPETWQAPRTTSSLSEPALAAMRPPSAPTSSA